MERIRLRDLLCIGLAAVTISACNSPQTPTVSAATSAATQRPTVVAATATPAAGTPTGTPFQSPKSPTGYQPGKELVRLATGSGANLDGFYYSAPSLQAPAVLLLSPAGTDPAAWEAFAGRLQTLGIASLAVAPSAADSAAGQATAAFAWLQARAEVDATRIGVVAAGGGAASALQLSQETPAKAILLLSPEMGEVQVDQVLKTLGRPALVVGERDLLDGSVGAWLVRSLG